MTDPPLLISSFRHCRDNTPQGAVVDWDELARRLKRHRFRAEKDGELWSPTYYPPAARRARENVIQLSCLVIDCDDGTPPEALTSEWENYAYLIHSTYSHTPEHPKWRAVFPLAAYVWGSDWEPAWERLTAALAPGKADPQCKDPSRIYYLPSCPLADTDHFAWVHEGARLDPRDFAPVPMPAKSAPEKSGPPRLAPPPPSSPERVIAREARVPAERLIEWALRRIVLAPHPEHGHGRHAGTKWLLGQLRDNGYTSEEAAALMEEAWLPRLPECKPNGKPEPFTPAEMADLWIWTYSQPARVPWPMPEPVPDPPEELAPPVRGRVPAEEIGASSAASEPAERTEPAVADEELRERTSAEILADVYTTECLRTREIPPLVYTVEEILPVGLTMIHGHSKLGKSFLGMDIAAGIALGGRVFGRLQAEKGRVLYLAMEDGPRRLKTRFEALFTDLASWPDNLHIVHDWKTMDARGFLLLKEWLSRYPDTRAIILDPWTALRPTHSRGGDIVIEDRKPLQRLERLGQSHQVSVLVLHHSAQHNKGDSLNNASGSSGVVQPATSVLEFSRKRGEHEALLKGAPKDGPEIDWTLRRDERTGFWSLIGDTEDVQTSAARAEILALLKTEGALPPRAIARALDRNEGTIGKLCRRMRDDGALMSIQGSYSLGNEA